LVNFRFAVSARDLLLPCEPGGPRQQGTWRVCMGSFTQAGLEAVPLSFDLGRFLIDVALIVRFLGFFLRCWARLQPFLQAFPLLARSCLPHGFFFFSVLPSAHRPRLRPPLRRCFLLGLVARGVTLPLT